jgi:hypothetical protein
VVPTLREPDSGTRKLGGDASSIVLGRWTNQRVRDHEPRKFSPREYFGSGRPRALERSSAEGGESIECGRALGGWLLGRVEAGGAELG